MSNQNLKFIFLGTPDVASKTLEILKSKGYLPSLIITSPDKPQGRKMTITPPPAKTWAIENNIPYLQPEKINEEFIEKLFPHTGHVGKKESHMSGVWPALSVVVAYGKILPENLIKLPKFGTVNIHYSLLPKYRGASPLEAALLNGDEETGISIQQMEYKLDSGPILKAESIEIGINDTKAEIREELINLGANCLCDLLPEIENNKINPLAQDESKATFCKKIKKEYGEINILDDSRENWNKYRAYDGWPGIFFFAQKKGQKLRIKIKEANYEDNSFIIKRVIPEGKKEMSYDEFLKWN